MSDLTKQSELKELADHIEAEKIGWLPTIGSVVNFTMTLSERDTVLAALRSSSSAGAREALESIDAILDAVWSTNDRAEEVDGLVKIKAIIRSALSDHGVQESGGSWRPIESAPRDGTGILVKLPDSDMPHTAKFWRGSWTVAWDHSELKGWDAPTHWMPIPELPSDSLLSKTLSEGEQRSIATKQSTDATSASGLSPALRAYQALFEPPESDAYDNLTGALLDIKRHIEADRPTDDVCVRTIERVLDQLNAAYTALAPANEGSSLRPDGGASS